MDLIEDYSNFKEEMRISKLKEEPSKESKLLNFGDYKKRERPLSSMVDRRLVSQRKVVEWTGETEKEFKLKRQTASTQVGSHFTSLNRYDALAIMPLINQLARK